MLICQRQFMLLYFVISVYPFSPPNLRIQKGKITIYGLSDIMSSNLNVPQKIAGLLRVASLKPRLHDIHFWCGTLKFGHADPYF